MKRNTMICFQPVNSTSTEWLQSYQQRLNPQSTSFPAQTGKEYFFERKQMYLRAAKSK